MSRQQRRADARAQAKSGGGWTAEMVEDVLSDPAVVGVGGYPPIIDDEQWIKAQVRLIGEMGAEAYSRNLLRQLRKYDPA